MAGPLLRLLEENLAPFYGRHMAPFVVRRALRHLGKSEDQISDRDLLALLGQIERSSLDRIYGANARLIAAEVAQAVHRGQVIDERVARRFHHGATATERARELI